MLCECSRSDRKNAERLNRSAYYVKARDLGGQERLSVLSFAESRGRALSNNFAEALKFLLRCWLLYDIFLQIHDMYDPRIIQNENFDSEKISSNSYD